MNMTLRGHADLKRASGGESRWTDCTLVRKTRIGRLMVKIEVLSKTVKVLDNSALGVYSCCDTSKKSCQSD